MGKSDVIEGELVSSKSSVLSIETLPNLIGKKTTYKHSSPAEYALVGKSENGRRSTVSRLNQFAKIFKFTDYQQVPWELLRYEHVKYVVQVLNDQKKAHTTINATLAALRLVAKEAFNLRQIPGDDLRRIMNVKMERGSRLPSGRHLPSGEILSIVQACERDKSPAGIRDIAIIGLMYICGLRRAEVAKLKVNDFDDEENEIRYIGKKNKERHVWPDSGTRAALLDWLDMRKASDGPLFTRVNKSGEISFMQISDQAVYNIVKKRWLQAGVRACTPHDFRRSFVTNLLANKTDVFLVQQLAGHDDPKTTMRYDMRDKDEARKAAEVLHLPYSSSKRIK